MKTRVGLWIDHRKAHIVIVTDKGEEMGLIVSKVKKQPRRSGDSPLKGPYEPHQVPAQDSLQRTLMGHLNIYYDAVTASIHGAKSIWSTFFNGSFIAIIGTSRSPQSQSLSVRSVSTWRMTSGL